ncbi:fluoride efflux transporter CrcB [Bacillus sp. FJAT-27251]|uniref:fluoride efflux transporter CrcB n=1 Tax=Bacillus sp. FJAT-27251 TaxID=1684142 RepID=UPI0006A77E76|nr:fluoride efflux transporter CrcB [Bacillus sp. FJAT-27251]
MNALYIMAGGFVGSICRYVLGEWISVGSFPFGTLLVNLAGCFFLGWFLTYASKRGTIKAETALMIGTGFTGSFTTFSTFATETAVLAGESLAEALLYIILSIGMGIVFSFLGYMAADGNGLKGKTG